MQLALNTNISNLAAGEPYKASLEPLSKDEYNKIPCFFYINPLVAEEDLSSFDTWFMEARRKPEVYSSHSRGFLTFYAHVGEDKFHVDWRVYRTWENTFHLRYKEILERLGLPTANQFIHPEKQFLVAALMQTKGLRPKALADCELPPARV